MLIHPAGPLKNSAGYLGLNQCRRRRALRNVQAHFPCAENAQVALFMNYVMRYQYFTRGVYNRIV